MISIHPPLFHLFREYKRDEETKIDWENSLRSENRIFILGIFLHTFYNDVGFLSFFFSLSLFILWI